MNTRRRVVSLMTRKRMAPQSTTSKRRRLSKWMMIGIASANSPSSMIELSRPKVMVAVG